MEKLFVVQVSGHTKDGARTIANPVLVREVTRGNEMGKRIDRKAPANPPELRVKIPPRRARAA